MRVFFCLLLISTALFSCTKKEEKIGAEFSYLKAKKLLDQRSWAESADIFEKIDDEFPFSHWGSKGKIMALYARYKNQEGDKVIQLADDFVTSSPSSEYVPYALYMKGLVYYNQIPSIDRAQDETKRSSSTFRELIARFPSDDHAIDAESKLQFIDEHIAGARMAVGRELLQSKHYIGAINNFNDVIKIYRGTNQVPEAYFRIAEIYYKIGLKNHGMEVIDEMTARFPQNEWTKMAAKVRQDFN
jgi:outer membrane protein assembly factor BamD